MPKPLDRILGFQTRRAIAAQATCEHLMGVVVIQEKRIAELEIQNAKLLDGWNQCNTLLHQERLLVQRLKLIKSEAQQGSMWRDKNSGLLPGMWEESDLSGGQTDV